MFDIGFWELAIIAVVALLVIGPEKLPGIARTAGMWFGKARRFVASVQEDINREVSKSEELQRLLEEQSKIKEMHEIIEHTVDDTRKTVSVNAQSMEHKPKALSSRESQQQESQQETQRNARQDDREPQQSSQTQQGAKPKPPEQRSKPATPSNSDRPADTLNEQTK
jgi:sec-independent protein translocase protein TatB